MATSPESLVHLRRSILAIVLGSLSIACSDLLAPSPTKLAGRWNAAPEAVSPRGQFSRTLEFTVDGHYVATGAYRGVYAALPTDSVASITRTYGAYVLNGDTLRFTQDSVRSWDYMTGDHLEVGPPGLYIEGPPSDPIIELTNSRLTLRFNVNPGNGYVPVIFVYERE